MAAPTEERVLRIQEGRFARLEAIEWWDQARLARARVLVIGAGALGNEVVKNLALLGVGHMVVADMDRVELSNLSRSVLFRESDEGKPKAECAARAATAIYPGLQARAAVGNVLADLGLGCFRWADAVIGALDNREARVFVNSACARVGRPWFDGGIEVLHGVVRGFAPPRTACYECTMSAVDWALLNKRRSCSLLARRALAQRGTPTTPTTASVIAGMQVQEAIKHLHGRSALLGCGFVFDGAEHASFRVNYPINPDCPWHEEPAPIEVLPQANSDTRLETLWHEGERRLGGLDALDLARELVERVECPACGHRRDVLQPAETVREDQLLCPRCGTEGTPTFVHSLGPDSSLLKKTVREIGLPAWDIVWPRRGLQVVGLEVAGDNFFAATQTPAQEAAER
jgi:molybdopterin/thiamine biosynthesis adenylyltransferase